jgi:hypothetical protein
MSRKPPSRTSLRPLTTAQLLVVAGGDGEKPHQITSQRDPSSGLPTGQRSHSGGTVGDRPTGPLVFTLPK